MARTYWLETLGCPKNQVDSEKLSGTLTADGLTAAISPAEADLVVVNTCAFIEEARQESIDVILELAELRRGGAELVVTGCLAERYGTELAEALGEVDRVAGFGVPVTLGPSRKGETALPSFDLLNLPRPTVQAPWAYLKVAEGCDRACGYCAIPSFRGPQRSRPISAVLAEAEALDVREVVLVAQDLASYGRDQGRGERQLVPLVKELARRVERVRLLYLYPADLTDELVDAILASGVAYFDLSLQHASSRLLRRMRRWGSGERFLAMIRAIRARNEDAVFRSNFIVGYPGETEEDHEALLRFVEEAELDWTGLFAYSQEEGTYASELGETVPERLVEERLHELGEVADAITAARRVALVGRDVEVLVDEAGAGRSFREAPEIDGIVELPAGLAVGTIQSVRIVDSVGPDLVATAAVEAVAR